VEVLVKQEFWENGTQRHRAGEIMRVTAEYLALYGVFLQRLHETKTVEKRR
jgi:hypothetical protein